ncbi:hypothetical protein HDK90DRAFT_291502 [Phyllosticta capitalensis]|uniref:Secreted protein n=1 Tax=Phyllosticta capitalensis TaxID=121624 RepID=A0ABR1YJG9_9PEZI
MALLPLALSLLAILLKESSKNLSNDEFPVARYRGHHPCHPACNPHMRVCEDRRQRRPKLQMAANEKPPAKRRLCALGMNRQGRLLDRSQSHAMVWIRRMRPMNGRILAPW